MSRASVIAWVLALVGTAATAFVLGRLSAPAPDKPPLAAATPPEPAVARWSGGQLTAAQLQARITAMKTAAGQPTLDAERARAFGKETLRTALLAAEARNRGLEKDLRAEGTIADALAKRLVERELDDPAKRPPLAEAEVSAWFAAHRDAFIRPEKIRLGDLVGNAPQADPAARKKVRAEFEGLRKKLAASPPSARAQAFADAAKHRSDDPDTGPGGGDLGPTSLAELEARLGPAGAKEAWAMVGIGQLELLETDTAFHLVQLEARLAGSNVDLEGARPQIESRIWYERRDAMIEKLVQDLTGKLNFTVDDAALQAALADVK